MANQLIPPKVLYNCNSNFTFKIFPLCMFLLHIETGNGNRFHACTKSPERNITQNPLSIIQIFSSSLKKPKLITVTFVTIFYMHVLLFSCK